MRRYLVPVVIVIVAVVAIGFIVFALVGNPSPVTTTTYTVRTGTINSSVRATGRIEAARSLQLGFRNSDVLRKLYVKPGDSVPAGTLLAELDSTNAERNLEQVQGQRDISLFNLSAAGERAASAPTPTAAPTTPASQVPSSFSDAYAAARQAELSDLQLTAARQALEGTKLYAPFDGTVLAVNAQEGEVVSGAALTFADLRTLQIRADIDELDVPNVDIGESVNITLDAFPGRNLQGTIVSLSPTAAARQGSSVYPAVISFQQTPTLKLRPGMAASLNITSTSKSGILVVPTRAVETIGLRKFVNLVKADGSTDKVPVETGITNGNETEIVTGLKSGDKITVPR